MKNGGVKKKPEQPNGKPTEGSEGHADQGTPSDISVECGLFYSHSAFAFSILLYNIEKRIMERKGWRRECSIRVAGTQVPTTTTTTIITTTITPRNHLRGNYDRGITKPMAGPQSKHPCPEHRLTNASAASNPPPSADNRISRGGAFCPAEADETDSFDSLVFGWRANWGKYGLDVLAAVRPRTCQKIYH